MNQKKKCQNKVKIECLKCSSVNNNNQKEKEITSNINLNQQNFIGDYELTENEISDNLLLEENYNDNNLNSFGYYMDKKDDLIFRDNQNYYRYNTGDIKDILDLPNTNNSFANVDKNSNSNLNEGTSNNNNDKIKLSVFDDIFKHNIKYKI